MDEMKALTDWWQSISQGSHDWIMEVFVITRLNQLFTICDDQSAALDAFASWLRSRS